MASDTGRMSELDVEMFSDTSATRTPSKRAEKRKYESSTPGNTSSSTGVSNISSFDISGLSPSRRESGGDAEDEGDDEESEVEGAVGGVQLRPHRDEPEDEAEQLVAMLSEMQIHTNRMEQLELYEESVRRSREEEIEKRRRVAVSKCFNWNNLIIFFLTGTCYRRNVKIFFIEVMLL